MAESHQPNKVLYRCQALSDVWTGDAEGKGGRLITTGLLGSIRWWFEVLVRGLGGRACDPSDRKHRCQDLNHCVVCELFGCTGWARKFRFEVLDADLRPKQDQIRAGEIFHFSFVELRPIREEEWALLELTLRLIAGYGALGGRTVFKPSDEKGREREQHHQDYGLIKLLKIIVDMNPDKYTGGKLDKATLMSYVKKSNWREVSHGEFAWASLRNFWYIKTNDPTLYLKRISETQSTFNSFIGRNPNKRSAKRHPQKWPESWLAGKQQESKKVFSFRCGPRTFGFVLSESFSSNNVKFDFSEVENRLRKLWQSNLKQDNSEWELIKGSSILTKIIR